LINLNLPSPLQEINDPILDRQGVRLLMKRDDLIHPEVSGNKWRKLKYNILQALQEGHTTLLSFGGAYSNHIHAMAAAAKAFEMKSIGVIRGEEVAGLNPTLVFAQAQGMQLHFVSREVYKSKHEAHFIEQLRHRFGNFYLIPEGGANAAGVRGCMEIVDELSVSYQWVVLACGTGTTLAGVVAALPSGKKALGIPVLKGGEFIGDEVKALHDTMGLPERSNWELDTAYHFGGYGKWKEPLLRFMKEFESRTTIPLEQVYTAKMMYGLYEKIGQGFFERGTTIIALHTGGLQGKLKTLE
jgi:1-aminocyclopropane-1-carboxylate deaminase